MEEMEQASEQTTAPCTSIQRFTYIIVGGGIAAVSTVEQILEFDSNAEIMLISASSVVKEASEITRLTKTLQDFILVEKSLKSFKDVHQSVAVLHDQVLTIDHQHHTVVTEKGRRFKYRKLCICTGGVPKIIFPQSQSEFMIRIRDTESVQHLASRITTARKILLLGNGGIATELVHEVNGVEIVWAVRDKSVSAHFVDPGAAEFFIQSRINQDTKVDASDAKLNIKDNSACSTPELSDETHTNVGVGLPQKSTFQLTKRMRYTISSHLADQANSEGLIGDAVEDKSGRLGSALGPDWHQQVQLKGLLDKKNVHIIYESECIRVITQSELKQPLDSSNSGTAAVTKEVWPIYGELTTGEQVGCDLIICATGVVPNCKWASNCEQNAEKGIFVDTAMRTSIPDVYAAGDVCFPNWTWAKHWFQMRLWTQARQMGLYAGKSMFMAVRKEDAKEEDGGDEEIELDFCFEIFSHVTKFFGFKVVLLGLFNGQGLERDKQHLLVRCTPNMEYIKVVLEDWRMQGAILIGETGLEETFENLILNQVDLSSYGEDLLNPHIDIEDYFD